MDATKIDAAFYNELKKHYSEPQIMDLGGEIISTKQGPIEHPGLRHELQARAFVVRTLQRLGLDVEAVKPVGRPPGSFRRG